MNCKICEQPTEAFGTLLILGKYTAEYRRCTHCGYVCTPSPHWLEEAYSSAIAALDTGIVVRNLWLADVTSVLLRFSLPASGRAIDFGGGSGLFVRLMRDRGHDFHWLDPHCPNLLAIGFEASTDARYDLATAFELVEHLPDPLTTFAQLATLAPRILLSTELLPATGNRPGEWPYYAPESGQHIGFFTRRSLEIVAERLGKRLSSSGRNLHVLADTPVSEPLLKWLESHRWARRLGRLGRRRPLTWRDSAMLQARLRAASVPATDRPGTA